MVEINLYLHDIEEISMFTDFARALDVYRARKYAPENWVDAAASCGPVQFGGIGAPAREVTSENFGDKLVQAVQEAVDIAEGRLEPAKVTRIDTANFKREVLDRPVVTDTEGVTQAQLEEALKAYGRAKGFPAARALLDEYTKGKLGDVPAEKHAELYAKLTA